MTVDVSSDFGEISAWVSAEVGSDVEKALLKFLTRRRLTISTGPVIPREQFWFPDLPVVQGYDLLPMPSDPSTLAELLTDCFRDVCGLDTSSELRFELPDWMVDER